MNLFWGRSDEREIKYSDGHDARPCSKSALGLFGICPVYIVSIWFSLYQDCTFFVLVWDSCLVLGLSDYYSVLRNVMR